MLLLLCLPEAQIPKTAGAVLSWCPPKRKADLFYSYFTKYLGAINSPARIRLVCYLLQFHFLLSKKSDRGHFLRKVLNTAQWTAPHGLMPHSVILLGANFKIRILILVSLLQRTKLFRNSLEQDDRMRRAVGITSGGWTADKNKTHSITVAFLSGKKKKKNSPNSDLPDKDSSLTDRNRSLTVCGQAAKKQVCECVKDTTLSLI